MYFVLYDKNLNSIGETYILESWNRTQRATDFDDLKIVGEQIPYSANPFLVAINDRQGRQMFSGLASTPLIDEERKKTTLTLKDYMTLFNSEIIVDWSKFTGTTVSELLDFVFNLFKLQIDTGLANINFDTTRLSTIFLDTNIKLNTETIENVTAYNLISDAINYYNLYYLPTLNLKAKTVTFTFYPAGLNLLSIKLSDFGFNSVEKSFGDFNRASVYNSSFVKQEEWALTEDNSVVRLPSNKNLVYPAKNKNFIADEPKEDETESDKIYDEIYNAVMELARNRYQENINLSAQQFKSIIDLTTVDFSYRIEVFLSDGSYKTLPVGEIETDSNGKYIVRLGHRIQELTQEL